MESATIDGKNIENGEVSARTVFKSLHLYKVQRFLCLLTSQYFVSSDQNYFGFWYDVLNGNL